MDRIAEDKTTARFSGASLASAKEAPASPPSNKDGNAQQSWGDKYSATAYRFTRNVFANYIVNFAISALTTYAVVESKPYQEKFKPNIVEPFANWISRKTKMPAEYAGATAKLFTITQILLVGGHSLLPFMKWTHDHKKELEFKTGHKLDLLQEAIGKGNAASKRHIEAYNRIAGLLSQAEHNRKERDPVAISLTDADRQMLANNGINDDLKFNEHKRSWKEVLKARSIGVSFTTTLSFLFATGSYFGKEKGVDAINVEKMLEEKGGALGAKIYGKLPIKDPRALGKYTLLELIYTAASKLGFDHIEKKQLHQEHLAELTEAKAKLQKDESREKPDVAKINQDKETLSDLGVDVGNTTPGITYASRPETTAQATRTRLLETGGRDFRTREAAKPQAPAMALS